MVTLIEDLSLSLSLHIHTYIYIYIHLLYLFRFKLYDLYPLFLEHATSAERPGIRSQFNSVLYQLLLDPSERVCFEAILCILGKHDSAERCACYVLILYPFFTPKGYNWMANCCITGLSQFHPPTYSPGYHFSFSYILLM